MMCFFFGQFFQLCASNRVPEVMKCSTHTGRFDPRIDSSELSSFPFVLKYSQPSVPILGVA